MLVNAEYYVSKSGQDKQYLEKPWLVVNGRVNGRVIMKAKGHSNQNYCLTLPFNVHLLSASFRFFIN